MNIYIYLRSRHSSQPIFGGSNTTRGVKAADRSAALAYIMLSSLQLPPARAAEVIPGVASHEAKGASHTRTRPGHTHATNAKTRQMTIPQPSEI